MVWHGKSHLYLMIWGVTWAPGMVHSRVAVQCAADSFHTREMIGYLVRTVTDGNDAIWIDFSFWFAKIK